MTLIWLIFNQNKKSFAAYTFCINAHYTVWIYGPVSIDFTLYVGRSNQSMIFFTKYSTFRAFIIAIRAVKLESIQKGRDIWAGN